MNFKQRNGQSQVRDLNEDSGEILMDNIPLKYKLVTAEGAYIGSRYAYRDLEKEVNENLKNGWKLYGGVSIGNISVKHFCVCQAMVKYDDSYSNMRTFADSLAERKIDYRGDGEL